MDVGDIIINEEGYYMTLFLIVILIATIIVSYSAGAARRGGMKWLKSRVMDYVLFILTLIAFIFSVGITGRIAIYISDYNSHIDAIMGGLLMNLALFFVPGILFVASVVLGVRLINPKT